MSSTKTAVLLPFNEVDATVLPSDVAGSLNDLGPDSGSSPALSLPTTEEALTGYGRRFVADSGLVGTEIVAGATRLRENLTIDALLEFDIDAAALSTDYTVCARGRGGAVSAAERVLYALVLRKIDATTAELALWWEDSSNVVAEVAAQFTIPEGPILVAASRQWNSVASVDVELSVNGTVIGTGNDTAGDIEGGDGGTFLAGCRGNGAADYQDSFLGVIDSLRVSRVVRSAEELRQFWRSILVHQPETEEAVRALLPKGVFSEDEDSKVQRFIGAVSDIFGVAKAKVAELAEDYLPNRAHSLLEDWESLLRLYVRPRDSIARRRQRAADGLQSHGYHRPGMAKTMADAFDLAEADVEFLTYTNEHVDALNGDLEDWWYLPESGGAVSAPNILHTALGVTAGNDNAYSLGRQFAAMQVVDGRPSEDFADFGVGTYAVLDVESYTLDGDMMAGVLAQASKSRDLLLVGIRPRAGGWDWGWREYRNQSWGAWNIIATTQSTGQPPGSVLLGAIPPHWIINYKGAGQWDIAAVESDPYVTAAGDGADDQLVTISSIESPTWVGWGLLTVEGVTTSVNSEIEASQWRSFFPLGVHTFSLQAFRDPALAGDADMEGAKRLFERKRPADTEGGATTVRVALYDDPASGYDEAPMA